ncbi:hypothetical protein [Giesbergeria anulus]|uniref:hypothetical protein n=1 Tax=Giesbergeria anulus TaxID=180197 RepID=UPI000B86E40D|nr:hypothetical protein [Giesbergeria anulus]
MAKFLTGIAFGFLLSSLFAPFDTMKSPSHKTANCETAGFFTGKKWQCTPEEKAELTLKQDENNMAILKCQGN